MRRVREVCTPTTVDNSRLRNVAITRTAACRRQLHGRGSGRTPSGIRPLAISLQLIRSVDTEAPTVESEAVADFSHSAVGVDRSGGGCFGQKTCIDQGSHGGGSVSAEG